jgi:hypothetical protein
VHPHDALADPAAVRDAGYLAAPSGLLRSGIP